MTALMIVGSWFVASVLLAPLIGATIRVGLGGYRYDQALVPAPVESDRKHAEIDLRIGA